MKKIISVFLLIVLIVLVFANFEVEEVYADVEIRNIEVLPNVVDSVAQYNIYIVLHKDLNRGENLYIKFPSGYTLPQSINKEFVEIAGYKPLSIVLSSNTVILTLSEPLFANQSAGTGGLLITISLLAGIKSPSEINIYNIELWTTVEPNHSSFPILIKSGEGKTVSNVFVQCFPNEGGVFSEYFFTFNVSYQGTLSSTKGDYVDVIFPEGTYLPEVINPENVLINYFFCKKLEIISNRVRIYIPDSVGYIYDKCNIHILKEFGVKNILIPGYYALKISTSQDTGIAISNKFEITGTTINGAKLEISPTTQGTKSKIDIYFKTSVTKKLIKNQDAIFIEFPKETILPDEIASEVIKVNGVACTNAIFESEVLKIISPINVSEGGDVSITIDINSGIKNPLQTGYYSVKLYTTSDSYPVLLPFQVNLSTISDVKIDLSNLSTGQISSYKISFSTGVSGNLIPGIDKINVVLPVGTTIPPIIANSSILVNEIPTTLVEISGTTLTITTPIEIKANSTVNLLILESAGLRNPVKAGNYKIYVFTTKEQTSIESNSYSIQNVPQTTLKITPENPDGQNGFYKTKPTITLSSTSATDLNPTIYYYFDNNSPAVYSGAIIVPEGVHTFYYYAIDKEGHKEEVRSLQVKVDTLPPVIAIISPQDSSVLSSKVVTIKGYVDPGSTILVDGKSVTVDGTGNFEAGVEISTSPQTIRIDATDIAGNTAQKTLTLSLDLTPPPLSITKPVMFQQVNTLPLLVEGKTEKGAKVSVNGEVVEVKGDGSFSFALSTLPEGELSKIEVVATDSAGNSTKQIVSVKYSKTTIIRLQVGNKTALINESTYTLEGSPTIVSGRTMVPLRFIGEAFGATFNYDSIFKIVDINFNGQEIKMQIGKKVAFVNGKSMALDVAPYIVNGRTLVPIRLISEVFGADVSWDGTTKTVTIIYPK